MSTSCANGKIGALVSLPRHGSHRPGHGTEGISPMQAEEPNDNGRQKKPQLPGSIYRTTPTKWVFQRGSRFVVRWVEDGERNARSFSTYDAACAYVRDYVKPYKAKEGALPPSAIAPAKGAGWVYVFRSSGDGEPVKIGWSSDPAKRLSTLRTGHPYKIDLVMLLPSGRGLEKAIHTKLAEYRLEGERFSYQAESLLTRLVAGSIQGQISDTSSFHRPVRRYRIPANDEVLPG